MIELPRTFYYSTCDSEYQHLISNDATASVASKILVRVKNLKSGISYTSIYVCYNILIVHFGTYAQTPISQIIRLAFRFF